MVEQEQGRSLSDLLNDRPTGLLNRLNNASKAGWNCILFGQPPPDSGLPLIYLGPFRAAQMKASTTVPTRSTWPQRILVAFMAIKDQRSVRRQEQA